MVQIAPSMLSADFLHLSRDVEMVNACADIFHLDVMDGVFVPNISYGFPIVEAIAGIAKKPLDAHLMIVRPENYIGRFITAGADMLSFHLNASDKPRMALETVSNGGVKAGLAINPDIPVNELFAYLENCDYVVIMSVYAGFGGQKFMESTYKRVETVKNVIVRAGLSCLVEVDGGVNPDNARSLKNCGADILVAGNSIFKSDNPKETIERLRRG